MGDGRSSPLAAPRILTKDDPVSSSIEYELSNLPPLPIYSCIYRVPENLRKIKEESYIPLVVSIGPFHHGDARLQPMEMQKLRYLNALRNQARNQNISDYVSIIRKSEDTLRGFYADDIRLSGDSFVAMVLLDSAFIIETFLIHVLSYHREEHDRIFGRPGILNEVIRDMKLLENQLPFFILEELYNFAYQPDTPDTYFRTITYKFFKVKPKDSLLEIKHFVDLLRACSLPSIKRSKGKGARKIEFRLSITELHDAGVKFEPVQNYSSLLDIEFTDKGVLKIPQLKLQDTTESFFRNMVAFEQCHYSLDSYIIDYVALLDFLVNVPGDMEILVKKNIVKNWQGNNQEATYVFNNLFKHVKLVSGNFYYSSLCGKLQKHYSNPWNRYLSILKRRYFSHPWAYMSFIYAVVLLVLALIQAVAGVLSVP